MYYIDTVNLMILLMQHFKHECMQALCYNLEVGFASNYYFLIKTNHFNLYNLQNNRGLPRMTENPMTENLIACVHSIIHVLGVYEQLGVFLFKSTYTCINNLCLYFCHLSYKYSTRLQSSTQMKKYSQK